MATRPHARADARATVPASPAPPAWQPTGNGVVFSEPDQPRRVAPRAGAHNLYRTVVFILVGAIVIVAGVTAVLDLDWFSPASHRPVPIPA